MSTIPTLDEEDIQALVGDQSFRRGEQYFSQGAIFDTRRQGMTLKARCEGSRSEAYHVQVTFDDTDISDVDCSCPIGGRCKHVAALLLTWLARPEEFLEEESVDAILEQCNKAELIAIIKQMLRRDPDLEQVVQARNKRQAQVNPEVYRRQAETAFRSAGNEWGVEADIASDLFEIKENADTFAEKHDYANAVTVYEALIGEMLKHASSYEDEEGELRSVINDCIEELDTWLSEVQDDSALREKMLQLLFAIPRFDIHAGGIGFGEEASEILLGHATAEERQKIVHWALDALVQISDKTGWERQQWGGFLLELQEETLDDETFLRICRETGRVADLVERLLVLGRVSEAVKETESIGDYDLLQIADIFVKQGHATIIEPIMWERAWKLQDTRLLEWLEKRYRPRKDPATPLLEAGLNFLRRYRPTLESYRELRDVARELGQWEKIRPAVIAAIKPPYDDLLIQIALDENNIDMIINMLKVEGVSSYSYTFTRNRVFSVVRTIEETQPETALAIYRAYVEYHIGQRNRQGYQEASWCLAIIRTLYNKLGRSDEWTNYITSLRERYHTLRALKEELTKAKL